MPQDILDRRLSVLTNPPLFMNAEVREAWRGWVDELIGHINVLFLEWSWRACRLDLARVLRDLAAEIEEECAAATDGILAVASGEPEVKHGT